MIKNTKRAIIFWERWNGEFWLKPEQQADVWLDSHPEVDILDVRFVVGDELSSGDIPHHYQKVKNVTVFYSSPEVS